jgi:hypothetical protein
MYDKPITAASNKSGAAAIKWAFDRLTATGFGFGKISQISISASFVSMVNPVVYPVLNTRINHGPGVCAILFISFNNDGHRIGGQSKEGNNAYLVKNCDDHVLLLLSFETVGGNRKWSR